MKKKIRNLIFLFKYTFARLTGRDYKMFPGGTNRTAAKSSQGFWYVGDIGASNDIAHGVLINGTAEPVSEKFILEFLHTSSKQQIGFYDIGANTGYFSILAAFADKRVTSYGFDPVPEFCETAKLSIGLNKLDNCNIFNFAVGNENTEADFFYSGTGTSLVPNFGRTDTVTPRKIKEVRLDNFIRESNLVPPDFLMIDVEGFELKVLEGARETIQLHHPVIYYECLPYSNNRETIARFLKNFGYNIEQIDDLMFLAKPA